LPEVQVSGSHFGTTALLGGEVPITGVAGDQQAAMFGQGCVQPGQAKNTYGTGCFFMLHTGENSFQSRHGLLTTRTAQVSRLPQYGLEGAVFNTGSLIQWLRDGLGIIQSSNEVETLARSVDHADQVMIVPAFNGLGSPHWDPKARGIIVGLTRGTNKAHLARAALQSIALQVAELVDAMQNDTKLRLEELYVDGGGSVNNLLMQMQADYLGVPVVRPKNVETTAFGAAALAAHTIGIFQYAQRDDMEVDRFEPRLSADAAQAKLAQWRKAVERCKDWVD
jgi:glycerol kinase